MKINFWGKSFENVGDDKSGNNLGIFFWPDKQRDKENRWQVHESCQDSWRFFLSRVLFLNFICKLNFKGRKGEEDLYWPRCSFGKLLLHLLFVSFWLLTFAPHSADLWNFISQLIATLLIQFERKKLPHFQMERKCQKRCWSLKEDEKQLDSRF